MSSWRDITILPPVWATAQPNTFFFFFFQEAETEHKPVQMQTKKCVWKENKYIWWLKDLSFHLEQKKGEKKWIDKDKTVNANACAVKYKKKKPFYTWGPPVWLPGRRRKWGALSFCQFVCQVPFYKLTQAAGGSADIQICFGQKWKKHRKSSGLSVFIHLPDKQTFNQVTWVQRWYAKISGRKKKTLSGYKTQSKEVGIKKRMCRKDLHVSPNRVYSEFPASRRPTGCKRTK